MSPRSDAAAVDFFPLVEPSRADELFDLISGSLVAGASADALGWVTEFMRSPKSIERQLGVERVTDYVQWRKKVGGRFNTYLDFIGAGEYSDDTQLTLAVARAIRGDGSVDHEYFAKEELTSWLDYARGAGRTITAAAKAMAAARSSWYSSFFSSGSLDYRSSGANGAAMRAAPIALANLRASAPPLEETFCNAITTHGHPRAHVGALGYVAAVWEAFRRRHDNGSGPRPFLNAIVRWLRTWDPTSSERPELQSWLREWDQSGRSYRELYQQTLDEFEGMLKIIGNRDSQHVLETLGCFDKATKGSGTTTVAAALHLFCWHGRDIEAAVTEAVNAVPADTDTIAAMVGSLAGAYAGYSHIPERWTSRLQDLPYFISLGEGLAHVAGREVEDDSAPFRPRILETEHDLPDIMGLLRKGEVERDSRVRHRVLGAGWVQAVHVQEIRRRGGGEMIYARVALDIGQTCQFRAHLPARTQQQRLTQPG